MMKQTGYRFIQVAGFLVLIGGILDISMTFLSGTIPAAHLEYLNLKSNNVPAELKHLDFAFLRALGACLAGIGIGTLTILYTGFKNRPKLSAAGILIMIIIAEGMNAAQLFSLHSQFFIYPLCCVLITLTGALLCFLNTKKEAV